MNETISKIILLSFVCFALFSGASAVLAYQSPTANAGPDLYVNSGQAVTLQGSGYDPQGGNLIYYWNCSGGSLSNASMVQPTFTAPNSTNQNYTCSLTVTNSYSLSASDTMIVYVNSNQISVGGLSVQTNSPTYISANSVTLNGNLSMSYIGGSSFVWFQWGTDTNYGSTTFQQTLGYPGAFSQPLGSLSPNSTYHFRAVAQVSGSTVYGQDMTFSTSGSGNYYGAASLSVTKEVINLSSGVQNWQASVNGYPGDVLGFAIILRAGPQDVHNVFVRDAIPANLIYSGNLTLNGGPSNIGNPSTGINIALIPANGVDVIGYQVQIASVSNFIYGTTTLSNSATVTSNEAGSQIASASVIVNNQQVLGATTVSTGLTNNPITDSFFLPMLLIILMAWLYFSGRVYKFSDWLKTKI
jgi:hypothetical protein